MPLKSWSHLIEMNFSVGVTLFVSISFAGTFVCFLPVFCGALSHSPELAMILTSTDIRHGLYGCVFVSSYVLIDEILPVLLFRSSIAGVQKISRIILLISLITPFLIMRTLTFDDYQSGVASYVISCQTMLLYLTFCIMVNDIGRPVWDNFTTLLMMLLIVIGCSIQGFQKFNPLLGLSHTSSAVLATVLAVFYYKSVKWLQFLFRKESLETNDMICTCYIGSIIVYTVVSLSTIKNIVNWATEEESTICIYGNSFLVLACISVTNQLTSKSMEKIQVFNSKLLFL